MEIKLEYDTGKAAKCAVYYTVRHRMLTRAGNLIFASFALLISIGVEIGCHSALMFSPPRSHHPPITVREIVMDAVALFWFAGAVGLFFRKRLAWVGSLVGVGATVCDIAAFLIEFIWFNLYPNAEMYRLNPDIGSPGDTRAFYDSIIELSLLLVLSLGLFIGLLRMRKELR